jgi:GNAT domain-containint protein/N-acyltransferase family protein
VTRGFRLPDRTYLPAIFKHLAIDEQDQREILAAWPSPETDAEVWPSFELAYETLVKDMGGFAPLDLPGPAVESTPMGRYFFVYVYLAALAEVRRFHKRRGIPDDISWGTLSDLGRNLVRDRLLLGDGGLRTAEWLTLHFRGAIYQLGRLQFNRMNIRAAERPGMASAPTWLAKAFREGQPALGIHIPESGALTPEACDDSYARAGPFFEKHFPETPTRIGVCTSWLLDPQLAEYLDPDSNIVRFQSRFHVVGEGHDGDAAVLRFVFHRIAPNIDDLSQRTTLERAIVAHIRAGKHWRSVTGWLEL